MFLTSPGACLDVIERSGVSAPRDLARDLDELGILHHHRMHNPQKRLVAGKHSVSASQCVALHESLTCMFGEDFDHPPARCPRVLVPLEVSVRVLQHHAQLVALKFVR
jgi:hypothetical protein